MTRQLKSKKARPEHGRRVFVGLSGGVDSSVSAALLKKAGFDVHGVFIRTWLPEWLPCTWKEERQDAMRVAAHLDIPFTTLDLEKEYKKDVADYMIAEYKAGRTPNPDVMCNKYIKFGAFYDWAMKEGASYVATGHYARVDRIEKHISEPERLTRNFNLSAIADKLKSDTGRDERYRLLAGVDKNKDQSYFLWTLKEEQLAHILFPVGQFKKPEVRKLAESFGLPTAAKKDSQGLCFMGKVDVKNFLSHYIKPKPGQVKNLFGEVIGHHNGAVFLTIGERHGFTITKKTPSDKPYFVISKNVPTNTVIVGHEDDIKMDRGGRSVRLEKANLIRADIKGPLRGRVRYRQPLKAVAISQVGDELVAEFGEPQTIASGQSLVFYRGEECIGGGVIK